MTLSSSELQQALLANRKRVASSSVDIGEKVDLNQAFLVNNHALRPIQKEIEKQLDSAHDEAKLIIERAEQEAQNILAEAQANVDDLRQQLLEDAHQNGYLIGQQQAYDEAQIQLKLAYDILAQAEMTREQILANASEKILDVSYAISSAILQYETQLNPNILSNLIEQAVQSLSKTVGTQNSGCEIVLNPSTFDHLLMVLEADKTPYTFKPDTRCPKDKVFLQANNLRWDISPRNQIDAYLMAIQHQQNLKEFLLEKNQPQAESRHLGPVPQETTINEPFENSVENNSDLKSDELNSSHTEQQSSATSL